LAVRLTKKPEEISEFSLWHARALAAAGAYKGAIKALEATTPTPDHQFLKCCMLYLLHKNAEEGFSKLLTQAIERFREEWPYHILMPLCEEMGIRMNQSKNVRLGLLLVGIDEYKAAPRLDRCVNDLELIKSAFYQIWPDESLLSAELRNEQATKANILQAFEDLATQLVFEDRFIFYYSGRSTNEGENFLLVHGSRAEGGEDITVSELNAAMKKIPTIAKGMILDTDGNHALIKCQKDYAVDYGLFIGASPGQSANETQMSGQTHGVFTYSLVEVLNQLAESDNWDRLTQLVSILIDQRINDQSPQFYNSELILSEKQEQDMFTDLIQYCEGSVRYIKPKRIDSMLHFALTKGISLSQNHLLRLAQNASLPKKMELYSA